MCSAPFFHILSGFTTITKVQGIPRGSLPLHSKAIGPILQFHLSHSQELGETRINIDSFKAHTLDLMCHLECPRVQIALCGQWSVRSHIAQHLSASNPQHKVKTIPNSLSGCLVKSRESGSATEQVAWCSGFGGEDHSPSLLSFQFLQLQREVKFAFYSRSKAWVLRWCVILCVCVCMCMHTRNKKGEKLWEIMGGLWFS